MVDTGRDGVLVPVVRSPDTECSIADVAVGGIPQSVSVGMFVGHFLAAAAAAVVVVVGAVVAVVAMGAAHLDPVSHPV